MKNEFLNSKYLSNDNAIYKKKKKEETCVVLLDLLSLSLVFTEFNLMDVVIKQIESVSMIINIA